MNSIASMLASSLGQRDEQPNIALAESIVKNNDFKAAEELMGLLKGKSKALRHDAIKVLYEIGERKPEIIAGYLSDFIVLLSDKDNRIQWGAMAAVDAVTGHLPDKVFSSLEAIMDAADKGSVITRDHAMALLIKLYNIKKYSDVVFPVFLEQLLVCPPNQLPMYAENMAPCINAGDKERFIAVLAERADAPEKESKRNRIEKVIRKLSK